MKEWTTKSNLLNYIIFIHSYNNSQSKTYLSFSKYCEASQYIGDNPIAKLHKNVRSWKEYKIEEVINNELFSKNVSKVIFVSKKI